MQAELTTLPTMEIQHGIAQSTLRDWLAAAKIEPAHSRGRSHFWRKGDVEAVILQNYPRWAEAHGKVSESQQSLPAAHPAEVLLSRLLNEVGALEREAEQAAQRAREAAQVSEACAEELLRVQNTIFTLQQMLHAQ